MEFRDKQIAAPKSWETFEDLCLSLFRRIWRDPQAQKHGRRGQAQHGVDIVGSKNGHRATHDGVQCKGKDSNYGSKATIKELKEEVAKAEKFTPAVNTWTFVTSARNDASLQKAAREISEQRASEGRFTVSVLGWEDIHGLLAEYPDVLASFYPEHAYDLPALIAELQKIPSGEEVRALIELTRDLATASGDPRAPATWLPVTFAANRDLGPALMGRPLGPADAASCPTLPETQTIVADLGRAYATRLIGEPGVGKSVCAYQAAMHLTSMGLRVLRLSDSTATNVAFERDDESIPTAYLIDDGHLMPPGLLSRLEAETHSRRLLLSAHSAPNHSQHARGAIVLDGKRAVHTIAGALRHNHQTTLDVVRRVDNSVGDRPFDEPLTRRIDHAEKTADRPWQFCFILGGGWLRARQMVDSARAQDADIVLAAAAIRQIASRDSRCTSDELQDFVRVAGLSPDDVHNALQWLVAERLLIGAGDCRTPHQRFGVVVIGEVLQGQDRAGRGKIENLLRAVLTRDEFSIAGVLAFISNFRTMKAGLWNPLIQAEWFEMVLQRCWRASTDERFAAAHLIAESRVWRQDWPRGVLEGHEALIGQWITETQSGYALARLVHQVHNSDKAFATALVDQVDPDRLALAISGTTADTAFERGELLGALSNAASKAWKAKFTASLKTDSILRLAASWPPEEALSGFSRFCGGLRWIDESLVLDMTERVLPVVAAAILADPPHAFHEIDDVAWHVLKGIDPLNIYQKRNKQKPRERALCRKLCSLLPPRPLAERLSGIDKRDFQSAASLVEFVRRADPRRFRELVRALDWSRLDETIGVDWRSPFHDMEVFLYYRSRDSRGRTSVESLIDRHLPEIETLPTRIAIISPAAVIKQVEAGRDIGIATGDHFEWEMGFLILGRLFLTRPDLAEVLWKSLEAKAAKTLSNVHPSWYRDGVRFIHLLQQIGPDSVARILDAIDVATAEQGWADALRGKPEFRRTIALLIASAVQRDDAVGEMARRLQQRYPAASRALKRDLEPFDLNPQSAAKKEG